MIPRRGPISLSCLWLLAFAPLLLGMLWHLNALQVVRAQSQPESYGSVSGVVHNQSGEPLANIQVTLEAYTGAYPARSNISDSNGNYSFPSLFPGTYRVKFSDPNGHYAESYFPNAAVASEATNVSVQGNAHERLNMTLAPAGAISLSIVSAQPVTSPVDITIYRLSSTGRWPKYRFLSQQLLVNNMHTIRGLPFGHYRLCACIDTPIYGKYYFLCYDNIIPGEQESPEANANDIVINSVTPFPVSFDVQTIDQVQGRVLSPNNEPLQGIVVKLVSVHLLWNEQRTLTDAEGNFAFGYVPPAKYKVSANDTFFSYPGYPGEPYLAVYYPNGYTERGGQTLDVQTTSRLNLKMNLKKWGQINGRVTRVGGQLLSNAQIKAFIKSEDMGWGDSCITFSFSCPRVTYESTTGIYTMTHLIPYQYRFVVEEMVFSSGVRLEGYHGGTTLENARTVTVGSGDKLSNINIEIVEEPFDGILTGIATATGAPLPGIKIGLYTIQVNPYEDLPHLTTTTDVRGNYRIEGIQSGIYRVRASDPNGRFATRFYEVTPGQTGVEISGEKVTPNINFDLSSGGAIRGQIQTPENELPGDFRILLYELTRTPQDPAVYYWAERIDLIVTTDKNGVYEIKGLLPQDYLVSARTPESNVHEPFTEEYYPATFDKTMAQPVTVHAEQTTSSINISFERFSAKLPFIVSEREAVK